MRRPAYIVAALAAAASGAMIAPEAALAHGLVGRADLPIPEWLFVWAAAAVLVVSFAALSTLWRRPKLEGDEGFRPLPLWLSRPIVNRVTEVLAGAVGVGVLAAVVLSGLLGTQSPQANLAPNLIYVIFWVGLVPASILFGDVFKALNPWRAIARATGSVASKVAGPLPKPFPHPRRLGHWPAVATLLGFTWMELAYSEGSDPSTLAVATLVYSALTMVGIAYFGTDNWIRYGEGFSVYFNLFSRISALAVRGGRLGLRRPLAGLSALDPPAATVPLLAVMLGTVVFDGASEGSVWTSIAPTIQDFFGSLGFSPGTSLDLALSVGMLLGIALVGLIFGVGIAGARTIDRRPLAAVARSFVHTLVPIAAAYAIAHYFSLLAYNGQAIAYLASDPLGKGWDLFGTAGRGIDYGVISATGIWYVQVGALVAGHVCGLVLAHDRALSLYAKTRAAMQSQYWMLGVMIAFTTLGLWLLSQANE